MPDFHYLGKERGERSRGRVRVHAADDGAGSPGAGKGGEEMRISDENAKLREELEAAKHDLQVFSANLARLGAENAKLRELVRERIVRCRDCGHCLTDGEGRYVCASLRCTTTPDGYCVWAKRR